MKNRQPLPPWTVCLAVGLLFTEAKKGERARGKQLGLDHLAVAQPFFRTVHSFLLFPEQRHIVFSHRLGPELPSVLNPSELHV